MEKRESNPLSGGHDGDFDLSISQHCESEVCWCDNDYYITSKYGRECVAASTCVLLTVCLADVGQLQAAYV